MKPKKAWPAKAKELHAAWWKERIDRQQQIDASIAANADQEFLYDKPYEDRNIVRVAGPFTVESLSPHRVLAVDEDDGLRTIGGKFIGEGKAGYGSEIDFTQVILENLQSAGVQQAHKEDRITFTALTGWPGEYICAEGRYMEGENGKERRAGIFIGPEFGTVARADWWPRRARPGTPASTCSSPAPSTTTPTRQSLRSSERSPSSRRG